jgi:anthranilate synthase component 1
MLHLALDGVELVGSSPELHVRVTDGADGQPRQVIVRPIAGTRPRGRTPADDARLHDELLATRRSAPST